MTARRLTEVDRWLTEESGICQPRIRPLTCGYTERLTEVDRYLLTFAYTHTHAHTHTCEPQWGFHCQPVNLLGKSPGQRPFSGLTVVCQPVNRHPSPQWRVVVSNGETITR